MAGRLTLAKSILLVIPNYFMSISLIPIFVFNEIEKIARNFIWSSSLFERKLTLVSWKDCYQPIEKGGLGIRRLEDQNKIFLLKLGFNI